jgi:hypothetical protein
MIGGLPRGDKEFLNAAEQRTVEKLLNLASQMMRVKELLKDLQSSYTSLKPSDELLLEYLLQEAELARLVKEVDETISDHEIQCHDCGEIHNLHEVALVHTTPVIVLRCPHGTSMEQRPLKTAEMKSLERILRFVRGDARKIFNTKVP